MQPRYKYLYFLKTLAVQQNPKPNPNPTMAAPLLPGSSSALPQDPPPKKSKVMSQLIREMRTAFGVDFDGFAAASARVVKKTMILQINELKEYITLLLTRLPEGTEGVPKTPVVVESPVSDAAARAKQAVAESLMDQFFKLEELFDEVVKEHDMVVGDLKGLLKRLEDF